jgi:hypothetical protein
VTPPNFSFDVNLGQLLVVGVTATLGWGLRKVYKLIVEAVSHVTHFVEQIHEDSELLNVTTTVVDDHSQALVDAGIMADPVVRLQPRRRHTDPAVIMKRRLP